MKKSMPRYCGECGAALMATPSGYATCPNMHSKLQPGKPDQFSNFMSQLGIDCRSLPEASRKGVCFAIAGREEQYRLRRPKDGEWKHLVKIGAAVLATFESKICVLVKRSSPRPARD